jgi:ElaB/YqjD/DUF883 family membrane-anchored ribosome-binding protein
MSTATKNRQSVAEDLSELGSHASDLAQRRYKNLKSDARQLANEGRERLEEMGESLEEYVAENPVKSLLIAAAAGLLVGRFILR